MDKELKDQHLKLADAVEDAANGALDRGIKFGIEHGAQASLGDLTMAGALFSAAAAIRERTKG